MCTDSALCQTLRRFKCVKRMIVASVMLMAHLAVLVGSGRTSIGTLVGVATAMLLVLQAAVSSVTSTRTDPMGSLSLNMGVLRRTQRSSGSSLRGSWEEM